MIIRKVIGQLVELRKSETSIPIWTVRYLYYKLRGKNISAHQKVCIKGLKNIETHGQLQIGTAHAGFIHKSDRTLLNISGRLIVNSTFNIGRGCRLDIGCNAVCSLGKGYVNSNAVFIIMHGLTIGENVAISWGCEFLDEYFHEMGYDGKQIREPAIEIGDNVWIGSGVKVLQGVKIGSGNVVAANSLVTKSFPQPNTLIGGNPAKVLKNNIKWK